jgi:putative flippase GtrA
VKVDATMFGLNAAIFWLSTIPEILALLQSIPYSEKIPLAKPKNIAYWYAQIIASAVVFLCNFLANRYYAFKPGKQSIPAQ